ncbi:MAG TPA: chitobiase/beta-hexosaminidase C-terminal domain-containing protein [Candidatus Cloacimonadota bacterium]|nr:chitobiase/beta-hexosaminidase C-terminal domain-containing protein [Candidatus Cloacimonadota bacterium]HQB40364.1 chitobiase/beta-hexosaminidase C-terminal domain-containing protein [Candidatus Cloacimonadota bacterium]
MKRLVIIFTLLLIFICSYAQIADPWGEPVIYGSGMTISARVKINGVNATTDDILIAQVGNQIRAKTNLINNTGVGGGVVRTFLIQTVQPGEEIVFKVWDYSDQRIYQATATLLSNPGGTIGSSPNYFYEINANITTHTISGKVMNEDLTPMPNISINISSVSPAQNFSMFTTLKTNSLGEYMIPGVMGGANITFSPISTAYTFNPAQQTLTNINANHTCNFIAFSIPQYTVSGVVLGDGQPLAGVNVYAGTYSATTDAFGEYALNLPGFSSYIITPAKEGWVFDPQNYTVSNLSYNQTNINFNATPVYYSITGNTDIENTTITISSALGNTYTSVISDAAGNYSIQGIAFHDTITLTPIKEGYTFAPSSKIINQISANQVVNFSAVIQSFTVSGTVTESAIGLSGVVINYQTGSTLSDANGDFSFNLPWHTSTNISFSKNGYRFIPATININNIDQNMSLTINAIPLQVFTISGTVLETNLNPLSDVEINYGNDLVTTDALGFYSFNALEGQDITLIPQKTGYSFTPEQITLQGISDNLVQNFSASVAQYTVCGAITSNGIPIANCEVIAGSNSIFTDNDGIYSFIATHGTHLFITPTSPAYTFTPPSREITITQNMSTQDFQATMKTFSVSGIVTYNGQGLAGVNISTTNTRNSAQTNALGYYELNIPYGSTCSVKAYKDYFSFSPASYSIENIIADIINRDFIATEHVKDPEFSPPPGIFTSQQLITITSQTPGAIIRYSLDGSDVDLTSQTYTEPIIAPEDSTVIIKAKAYKAGLNDSQQVTAQYIITGQIPDPIFNYASGIYNNAIHVSIEADSNAVVYFTKNNEEPTIHDNLYSAPLFINSNCTLKAKAFRNNYLPSNTSERNYQFNHIISFNLPDSLIINENTQITLNMLNYIDDSIEGTTAYSFVANISDNFNLILNNHLITIIPQQNWTGTGKLFVNGSFDNVVTFNDSAKVIARTLNLAPIIESFSPEDSIITMGLDEYMNFYVNALDYDDDNIYYSWYVDAVNQHVSKNYFSFSPPNTGEYEIKCSVTDFNSIVDQTWSVHVGLANEEIAKPHINYLSQNYPNPFNPNTTIDFSITKRDYVNLAIYNIKGQRIKSLVDGFMPAGTHSVTWDGTNEQGKKLNSGIYLYKITSSNFHDFKKAILLK